MVIYGLTRDDEGGWGGSDDEREPEPLPGPSGRELVGAVSTSRVTAERWDGGWELHIQGEGVTQVDDLDRAEQQVRDYLESLHGGSFADAQIVLETQ